MPEGIVEWTFFSVGVGMFLLPVAAAISDGWHESKGLVILGGAIIGGWLFGGGDEIRALFAAIITGTALNYVLPKE